MLQARGFDHSIFAKPRRFTRHMTSLVRYPKMINDIGRTVDARRTDENHFSFEIRQKRYLGRGTYVMSAIAKGMISYDEASRQTRITGYAHIGGQYVALLSLMTIIVLLSLGLLAFTILFLPVALLMLAVLALHWMYLFVDRRDIEAQLAHLVDLTEREESLTENKTEGQNLHFENIQDESATLQSS